MLVVVVVVVVSSSGGGGVKCSAGLFCILLDVGVGSISKGATQEESGIVFFAHVAPVGFVLQSRVELHEHENLVRGQEGEVVRRVGYDVPLGRRVTGA